MYHAVCMIMHNCITSSWAAPDYLKFDTSHHLHSILSIQFVECGGVRQGCHIYPAVFLVEIGWLGHIWYVTI